MIATTIHVADSDRTDRRLNLLEARSLPLRPTRFTEPRLEHHLIALRSRGPQARTPERKSSSAGKELHRVDLSRHGGSPASTGHESPFALPESPLRIAPTLSS